MNQTLESSDGIHINMSLNEGIQMILPLFLRMKISTQTSWSHERNPFIASKEALNGH